MTDTYKQPNWLQVQTIYDFIEATTSEQQSIFDRQL